jgi:hypothetical protein
MNRILIAITCFLAILIFSANGFANDRGTISGRVTIESTGECSHHAKVTLYNFSGTAIDSIFTDETGHYQFECAPGGYFVSAEGDNLVKKYFPDQYLFKGADRIDVNIGQDVNASFSLSFGGWISGEFNCQGRDANRGLITALKIDEPATGLYKSIVIDEPFPSNYSIDGLLPGIYKILGRARGNGTEYYPGVEHYMDATPVSVIANSGIGDISFNLNPIGWGTIRGRVYDNSNGNGLQGIVIDAYQYQDFWKDPNLMSASSSDDGSFSLDVPAGEYYLFASYLDQNNPGDYKALYYNNRFSPFDADAIEIQPDGNVDGVNFAIDYTVRHDFSISGVVADADNYVGMSDIVVTALDYSTGYAVASAFSSHNGDFSIHDLAAGQYILMYSGAYVIPYFYNGTGNWQNAEIITLQDNSRYITMDAITQDYGNFGLAITGKVKTSVLPLDGARIYAYPAGEENPVAFAASNSDGVYEIISGLTPGSYIVKCDLFGFWSETYPEQINLDLIDNPEADGIDFQLRSIAENATMSESHDGPIKITGNYPNPFNAQTSIGLFSESGSPKDVTIVVYNLLGQQVGEKNVTAMPGSNVVRWGLDSFAGNVPSGVYFYKAAGSTKSYRMILLK